MSSNNEKIFTSQFFLIFGALFFTSFVMYVLMSPITEYTTNMGASASVAGLASGIYVIGGLISLIYSGQALQKWGWRKTAYVFLGLHLVVCLLYFISNNIPMLLLVRFLHGIGMGAGGAAIITIATPILPAKRFGEAMGYFLTGTPLAVGFGPIVGDYLIDNFGATSCFLVATVFAVLALVCILFVEIKQPQTEDYDTKSQYSGIKKFIEPNAIPISIVASLCSFGYVGIISFSGVYAHELNLVEAFSLFFIIYSIILIIARPLGGKIQDKFGNWLVTIVPITLQSIGVFLIALYPSFVSVIICAVCTGVGFGTFYSIANAMVTKNAPEERHSYAIATYLLCTDIALGFGPAFLGLFATTGNYGNLFLVSAIISIFALPLSIVVLKRME